MRNLQTVLRLTGMQLRKNLCSLRVGVLAALVALLLLSFLRPFVAFALDLDLFITPFAFVFLVQNSTLQMLLSAGVVLLFCNAPFQDEGALFSLYRCGSGRWWAGNVLYVLAMSLCYALFVLLCSVLFCIPALRFSNQWGSAFSTLAMGSIPESYQHILQFGADSYLRVWYTPLEALGLSFLLEWGCFCFLGLCIYLGNRLYSHAGVWIGGFFCLWDITIYNMLGYVWYKTSPITLAQLSFYVPNMARFGFSLAFARNFFLLSIPLLALLTLAAERIKRKRGYFEREAEIW